MIYLHDLLPEEISDEVAYYMATFAMDIALAIESHYYAKMRRYLQAMQDDRNTSFITDPSDSDTPI